MMDSSVANWMDNSVKKNFRYKDMFKISDCVNRIRIYRNLKEERGEGETERGGFWG